MAEPIIKAALDTIEIVFYHKWEIQTGDNRKCCNAKKMIVKILNSRTIPEQAWKSGFFQVHFQYQKNPEQFKKFKEFQNHWAPWNSIYGIAYIPPVIFHCPQLKDPPSYFRNVVLCWSLLRLATLLKSDSSTASFWCLYNYQWADFKDCSGFSIVEFEQVNTSWVSTFCIMSFLEPCGLSAYTQGWILYIVLLIMWIKRHPFPRCLPYRFN